MAWLLFMPACTSINEIMQTLGGVSFHMKLVTNTRIYQQIYQQLDKPDMRVTQLIGSFRMIQCKWHDSSTKSQCRESKIDRSKDIIIHAWEIYCSKSSYSGKLTRPVPLGSQSTGQMKGELVNADPQLLFQRLITIRERCEHVTPPCRYEICS